MGHGLTDGLAGGRVPEPRRLVVTLPVRMDLPSGLKAKLDHTVMVSEADRWAGRWRHPRAAPPVIAPSKDTLPSGLNAIA